MVPFFDRIAAGKELGSVVGAIHDNTDSAIFGLPRGGVVVAAEVANALHAPVDILNILKIGHPSYAEYAIGAVSDDDVTVLNINVAFDIHEHQLQQSVVKAREEAQRRKELYFAAPYKTQDITGKTAIIVDEGMATGYTMEAAARSVRKRNPSSIVVAVPVASLEAVAHIARYVDEVVILEDPYLFNHSVGQHYNEFRAVSDATVMKLLKSPKLVN